MKTNCALVILLALAAPAAAITVATVPVGSPGNLTDPGHNFQSQHYGAVAYNYRIGTYEVTNAQYAAFLNTVGQSDPYGLYNAQMGSDARGGIVRSGTAGAYAYSVKTPALNSTYTYDNKPVELVSWYLLPLELAVKKTAGDVTRSRSLTEPELAVTAIRITRREFKQVTPTNPFRLQVGIPPGTKSNGVNSISQVRMFDLGMVRP